MELSRRNFIKGTAAMAAFAAAGLAGCAGGQQAASSAASAASSAASSAEASASSAAASSVVSSGDATMAGTGRKTYVSVCRYCGTGCGVLVEAEDGKLISVTGDPQNNSSRGLNCVKGYYLASMLRGENRLTVPLIRDDPSTKGTPEGLREATWEEALDLAAAKMRLAWQNNKATLGFWGSGQQPIVEGYLTAKFWKAGLRCNNIDPNARLCMASAVVAFMNVFGTDEPSGCYEDIEHADVLITWGANMAEAHPVLYSRLTAHKVGNPDVKHYDVTTLTTRTSASADKVIMFRPGTDNAIANCIANYLVENDKVDHDFINDHLQFKTGTVDLGNAFKDDYDVTDGKTVDKTEDSTFEEYAELLKTYTLEYTSELSGVSVEDLTLLCETFANHDLRVMSLWTMGVNQHNRGTWMNHNIYNMHLISGHFGRPGDTAFSLTGQPTACGTAREVGTFCHRLPADLVVANEVHRRYTEAVWDLPEGYLDVIKKPGMHTVKMFRSMSSGKMSFLWTAHNNWAVSMPNLTRFLGRDGEHDGVFKTFIVVNEIYPTLSTQYADVVFPVSAWSEKEGQFGNAERRTSVFEKAIDPPGDARWDVWVLMQMAKRVLKGYKIGGKDSFEHLFGFVWDSEKDDFVGDQREVNRLAWEEYRIFSNPKMKDSVEAINAAENLHMEAKQLAPYEEYIEQHGLSWPVREVDGKWVETKWRFIDGDQAEGFDQVGIEEYGTKGLAKNVSFYKTPKGKPSIVFRPYEPPAYEPSDEYPFWFSTGRLLEHWHSGSMTRQVPELNRAVPESLLYMNAADAEKLKIKSGDRVKVTTPYGEVEITATTADRFAPPEGMVFCTFFAEETLINLVVEDVYCPLSKEPDFKKTVCKIEKA